jgi:hypothetical protein
MNLRAFVAICAPVFVACATQSPPASTGLGGTGGKADTGTIGSDAPPDCLSNDNVDCKGNADCELCKSSGQCASGPDPVWYNGNCECFDDPNGTGCKIGFCCAAGETWDFARCECVGTTTGSDSGSATGSDTGAGAPACLKKGTLADCNGNADCELCWTDGACAAGPDPVWFNGDCVCFDDPNGIGCMIGYCCSAGFLWNKMTCECEPSA